MKPEELETAIASLTFGVIKSVRYHDRRSGFYDSAHKITSLLTVLMAGAIVFQIDARTQGGQIAIIVGWIAALFAGTDVVVGFANKAGLHKSLKNRFIELQVDITKSDNSEESYKALNERRLRIESDEPTPYRAIDVMSRNEVVLAEGHSHSELKELNLWVRLTANFYRWPNIGTSITANEKSCCDTKSGH